MKLSALDTRTKATTGAEMELFHPVSGEGTGMFLNLLGHDSDAVQIAGTELKRKRLKLAVEKGANGIPHDEDRALLAEAMAIAITDWRNIVGDDGVEIPYSAPQAALMLREYPVVAEQVEAFVYNRANFLKS